MTARLLWFVVLLVTIATYTMAFQCYQSENVTTTEITCQSGWCLTAIALSGEAFYDCDANAACADIGNECVDNKVVHDQGLKSICCCNSDLCNNGTTAFQCYQGPNGSTTEVTCQSGWCLTGMLISGEVHYDCDSNDACASVGNGCYNNQSVLDNGYKSICCCNSDLCNKGSIAFQCYSGVNESTTEVSCQSSWCATVITLSGEVHYACDSGSDCASVGNGCHSDQTILDAGFKSVCCCNMNLCNEDAPGSNITTPASQLASTTASTPIPTISTVISNAPFDVPPNGLQNFTSQVSIQEPLELLVQVISGSIENIYVSFCPNIKPNSTSGTIAVSNQLINGKIYLPTSQLSSIYSQTFNCQPLIDRDDSGIEDLYLFTAIIQAGIKGALGSLGAVQGNGIIEQTSTSTSSVLSGGVIAVITVGGILVIVLVLVVVIKMIKKHK